MGVILYVLLAGYLPFDEPHMSALFRKIQKAEFSYPAWFSDSAKAFLGRILVPDPAKRSTVPDIEADAWFRGKDNYADDNLPFSLTEKAGGGSSSSSSSSKSSASQPAAAVPAASPGGAGSRVLQHHPSQREMEEAVGGVEEEEAAVSSKPSSSSSSTAATGKQTAAELSHGPASAGAPRSLNAFDVIAMLGSIELKRLVKAEPASSAAAVQPQFLSRAQPKELLARLTAAMTAMGASVSSEEGSFKVKGKLATSKGEIVLAAIIYSVTEELFLVEISRGKGEIIEYNSLLCTLRSQKQLMEVTLSSSK
jgi:serine/threonine protein kinase